MNWLHPILSCKAAAEHEQSLLAENEERTRKAMTRAGEGVGLAVARDFWEAGPLPDSPVILVLAGKGHNAGDALIAVKRLLAIRPGGQVRIVYAFGRDSLKPLVERARKALLEQAGDSVTEQDLDKDLSEKQLKNQLDVIRQEAFDIALDGLMGMQFSPPLRAPLDALVASVNNHPSIRFRAAVDLPTGMDDDCGEGAFRADFTYATGIAKAPLFIFQRTEFTGRIRYIDIGFFANAGADMLASREGLLLPSILDPLRGLRSCATDKRHYGHLFVICGSRAMPGALLMSVRAALASGAGLVTAFGPESVTASLAAAAPEAMWQPLPETSGGALGTKGLRTLRDRLPEATAVLMGPGMGREEETIRLMSEGVRRAESPVLLDADALQPEILEAVGERPQNAPPVVVTPHLGEFKRISRFEQDTFEAEVLRGFCRLRNVCTLFKGPVTRISDGDWLVHSPYGGPVLARGGSGDLLAGLAAGLLARQDDSPALEALCRAAAWHGLAADWLARRKGHEAVRSPELLEGLPAILRGEV